MDPHFTLLIEPTDGSEEVKSYYKNYSPESNDGVVDLLMPRDVVVPARSSSLNVTLGVKASMRDVYRQLEPGFGGFHWTLYNGVKCVLSARPSTELNTPIRLSDREIFIESYQDDIAVAVDNTSDEDFTLKAGERYFQLGLEKGETVRSVEVMSLEGVELNYRQLIVRLVKDE